MVRVRSADRCFFFAVWLTILSAAMPARGEDNRKTSESDEQLLATQYQTQFADSLFVLVRSEIIEAKAARASLSRRLPPIPDRQQVPGSSLVSALLAAEADGFGSGSSFAAAAAASGNGAGQGRGRRPVSPNGPPDGPPGRPDGVPPDGPPGPPDGVPPGPPDGKGRK